LSIASEINRIQKNVSDSLTAVANKGVVVPSGSNSDDLPGLIAQITSGSGSAIVIEDEEDPHGGIVRTITAVSLTGDTVSPSTLLSGYTAHNSLGEPIVGTYTGGSTARYQTKTITPTTSNQTVQPDTGYDALSSVTVNRIPSQYIVPSGSQTITQNNTYDVSTLAEVVVSVESGGSGSVTWEEIKDQDITIVSDNPNYFVINNYTTPFAENETYRITWGSGGTQYICQTIQDETGGSYDGYVIGNPGVVGHTPNTGEPFLIYRNSSSRLAAATNASAGTLHITIERQTSSGGNFQAKTGITPSTSSQTIVADEGYDALSSVQINAMPAGSVTPPLSMSGTGATVSTGTNTLTLTKTVSATPVVGTPGYVSSGTAGNVSVSLTANVNTRSSSDLTASGATVTVPAGYYASQASKSVSTMTLPTSAASSATSGYTSKATIGRSTSNQYINIPAGYNSAGGYYTISATPNGTATAPASISGTSASVSTGTNTITLTKTVSVTPNVSTAGYISSGTAGNSSVSLTASVTTKAAATITPTKSAQTIASGTYLTGTQTIAAIPAAYQDVTGVTAAAGDVVSGKSIVDASGNTVNGSLVIQHYYTGSGTPASSLGQNGDIYFQS
jgi:hypothetical protein